MNAPADECMHICLAVLSAQRALMLDVAALWEHATQTKVQTMSLICANTLWCSYLSPGGAGTGKPLVRMRGCHADLLQQNESQNPTEKVGESKAPLVTSVCLLTRARTAVSAPAIAEDCVSAVWICERRRLSARKVVGSAAIRSFGENSLLG